MVLLLLITKTHYHDNIKPISLLFNCIKTENQTKTKTDTNPYLDKQNHYNKTISLIVI